MADDRTKQALATLEQGIMDLLSGDKWREYLRFQARFHRYSFGNTILIQQQCPDATQVSSFNAWKQMGRHVKKGEKAIWILAPRSYRVEGTKKGEGTDDEGEERRGLRFVAVPVFDVSQTDGEPLPSLCSPLAGDDRGLFAALKAYRESFGSCPVSIGKTLPAHGYFAPKEDKIVIGEHLMGVGRAKTLAHEITHSILHRDIAEYHKVRPEAETEAESVAYLVLSRYEIPADDYSFGYIASWQGGDPKKAKEALRKMGATIVQTADMIITGLERLTQTQDAAAA